MERPIRSSQPSGRAVNLPDAVEQAIARFQDRLRALERESEIFRAFAGWQDESHRARAHGLLHELSTLERQLGTDAGVRLQLAFQAHNLLLRYQAFKRTHRQFWEDLAG